MYRGSVQKIKIQDVDLQRESLQVEHRSSQRGTLDFRRRRGFHVLVVKNSRVEAVALARLRSTRSACSLSCLYPAYGCSVGRHAKRVRRAIIARFNDCQLKSHEPQAKLQHSLGKRCTLTKIVIRAKMCILSFGHLEIGTTPKTSMPV